MEGSPLGEPLITDGGAEKGSFNGVVGYSVGIPVEILYGEMEVYSL